MHKVTITLEVPDDHYRAFVAEAVRRETRVEVLVEQVMQNQLAKLEREERDNDELLIIPS